MLEEECPGASVFVVGNVHEAPGSQAPFEGRSGALFVGGFGHAWQAYQSTIAQRSGAIDGANMATRLRPAPFAEYSAISEARSTSIGAVP